MFVTKFGIAHSFGLWLYRYRIPLGVGFLLLPVIILAEVNAQNYSPLLYNEGSFPDHQDRQVESKDTLNLIVPFTARESAVISALTKSKATSGSVKQELGYSVVGTTPKTKKEKNKEKIQAQHREYVDFDNVRLAGRANQLNQRNDLTSVEAHNFDQALLNAKSALDNALQEDAEGDGSHNSISKKIDNLSEELFDSFDYEDRMKLHKLKEEIRREKSGESKVKVAESIYGLVPRPEPMTIEQPIL